jgi:hypothetical protein
VPDCHPLYVGFNAKVAVYQQIVKIVGRLRPLGSFCMYYVKLAKTVSPDRDLIESSNAFFWKGFKAMRRSTIDANLFCLLQAWQHTHACAVKSGINADPSLVMKQLTHNSIFKFSQLRLCAYVIR